MDATSRRSLTSTKVFVGSLAADATVEDLRKLFNPYGAISECDIANRCGFLHLEDRELAMKAIEELNNTQFMNSRIAVELGRSKIRRSGGGPPPRNFGGKLRGGMTNMGRDRGPYSRSYEGSGGPIRAGGYDRDYYDRNSVLTPVRNNDRSYNNYADRRGASSSGIDLAHGHQSYENHYHSAERRSYPAYQTAPNNGYTLGGGVGVGRSMGGYDDNHRMGGGAIYDDRGYNMGGAAMYDDHRPPALSSGIMGERRPISKDHPGFPQSNRMENYGMEYSRRDSEQAKPLMLSGGYGDRDAAAYAASGGYASYSPAVNQSGSYQMSAGSYGDHTQMANHDYTSAGYVTSANRYDSPTDYSTVHTSGGGAYGGAYGDAYGQRVNYENAYATIPQQRGGYAAAYEQPPNYHY